MPDEYHKNWWTGFAHDKKKKHPPFWANDVHEGREPKTHKEKKRKKGGVSTRSDGFKRV